ncbi:MAG: serine/threonine protein kinase [Myxococcales bacterium]|nr:serine/threonine protein kinase [Myxococcales bacterium]
MDEEFEGERFDKVQLAPGDMVADRYRIVRVLGEGGMGTVYEAEHGWTRRRVALKVLKPSLATNDKIVSRFLREARACSKIAHPNLVAVLDMGQDEHDGLLFLAQELVEGRTLRAVIAERGPLSLSEARAIIVPIAHALGAVHAAGIVHRDVKPENIMVLGEGPSRSAKLIDFGVARELVPTDTSVTRTSLGVPIGTPLYMSPEQARASGVIDHRSDLYSLAAVLFECLTQTTPHTGETVTVLLANLLTQPAPSLRSLAPSVDPALDALVARALARDPSERFQRASDFVAALEALSASEIPMQPGLDAPVAPAATLVERDPSPAHPTRASSPAPSPVAPPRAASGRIVALAAPVVMALAFVVARSIRVSHAPAPSRVLRALDASPSDAPTQSADASIAPDAPDAPDVLSTTPPDARIDARDNEPRRRITREARAGADASAGASSAAADVARETPLLRAVVPDASAGRSWLLPVVPQ